MFWIAVIFLTAMTLAIVVYPLTRRSRQVEDANAYDLTIYKAQMREVESDLERGLIGPNEAEAARVEVARRLLAAQDALNTAAGLSMQGESLEAKQTELLSVTSDKLTNSKMIIATIIVLVPLASLGLYSSLGSPDLPGQALASRLQKPPEQQSLTELVASAERRLSTNPDDLQGWKRLVPIYAKMRRMDDAIEAYQNILRMEGESAPVLAGLAEMLVLRQSGIVSDQALAIFRRANALDDADPKPRFFIAIAMGQKGLNSQAIEAWRKLVADSPKNAPWLSFANDQIVLLEKRIQAESRPAVSVGDETDEEKTASTQSEQMSGPSREDVEAASELSEQERFEMIETMVSQLADRLKEEGGTADEWVRLIRSQLILNRPDMAAKSVTDALAALQSDVEGLGKVKAAAQSLGVSIGQ